MQIFILTSLSITCEHIRMRCIRCLSFSSERPLACALRHTLLFEAPWVEPDLEQIIGAESERK